MSKMRGEPVEVWLRDGRPARFVWRGRLYTVLVVLDRWMTSREWWVAQHPDPGAPAEREFWRVEASPGKNVPSAIYELRHDAATGSWLMSRSWD